MIPPMRYLLIFAFALSLAAWSGPAAAQTPKGDAPEEKFPPLPKFRVELMLEAAPDWFRPVLTEPEHALSDEEVKRLTERAIDEGVAIARCVKANNIAWGRYSETAYREIPALLDGYRLDECTIKATMLAVLYRDGRGVARDPERARHYFRKHVIHFGSDAEATNFMVKSTFGLDSDIDITRELAAAATWFEGLKNRTSKEQVIALAKRYLSGDGVPKDADIGDELLRSVGSREHIAESAYLLGIGYRDKAFSYSRQFTDESGFLMYIAAKMGHAQARKEMGLRMLKGATLENSRFFFAYAYFLAAKQAGAADVDDYLERLKKRLADPYLDAEASDWIDEGRLPPAS